MMELSPMPPISEDCSSQGDESDNGDEGDSNFEQLMVTMLEERDKLQENLRESQDLLQNTIARLQDVEKEKNLLHDQLSKTVPQDYIVLTRELNQIREALGEREEEINELKSERNNTRLLLEHLETLVSRHEKSLRMTVVKRQTQNSTNSGVSSEAEVLKALKSLFEHHKALDERYREKYKIAIEKCNSLEDELEKFKNELKIERESKQLSNQYLESLQKQQQQQQQQKVNDDGTTSTSDSSIDQKIAFTELQAILDKQSKELTEYKHKIHELQQRLKDNEEKFRQSEEKNFNLSKELLINQERNKKMQQDLKESQAQKDDQEQRIMSLEQRYVTAERECRSLTELKDRLETQLSIKENSFKHAEERYKNLQSRLDSSEQKYDQLLKKTQLNSLTTNVDTVDTVTKNNLIAQYQEKHTNIEEKLLGLQAEVEDAKTELIRSRQREKMSEDHNTRLTQTLDKLLGDSNERLQLHLKERMQSLDEKNMLTQECERLNKLIDNLDSDKNKLYMEIERLKTDVDYSRKEQSNLQQKFKEMNAGYMAKLNQYKMNEQMYAQQQQQGQHQQFYTDQLLTIQTPIGVAATVTGPSSLNLDFNNTITAPMAQRFNTYEHHQHHHQHPDCNDWDKLDEAVNVIANVQHAFDMGEDAELAVTVDDIEDEPLMPPYNRLFNQQRSPQRSVSPPPTSVPYTEAQTIAFLLQKQLDDIDNEIRLIKEEKQNAQLRSEEIGLRVGCFDMDDGANGSHLNNEDEEALEEEEDGEEDEDNGDDVLLRRQQQMTMSQKSGNSSGRSTPQRATVLDSIQKQQQQLIQRHMLTGGNGHMMTSLDCDLHSQHDAIQQSILANYPAWNGNCGSESMQKQINEEISRLNNTVPHSPLSSTHSSDDSLNKILIQQQQQMQLQQHGGSLQQQSQDNKRKLLKKPFFRLFSSQRKKSQKELNDIMNQSQTGSLKSMSSNDHILNTNWDLQLAQQQQLQQQQQQSPSTSIILTSDLDKRHKKKLELLEEAMRLNIPFQSWNGPTIVAWLELWVGMPAWYVAACKANVKSGSIMSALSEAEIHREIGISNPLHRLKLRLAIQEMVSLTSPTAPRNSSALALAFGDMNHEWIGNFFLKHLGLEQYRSFFMECLIDARMLDHLTKKDLRGQLKMIDGFHRDSLHYGICVLKRLNFSKAEFLKRILDCEADNKDLLVWSNERIVKWLQQIGLKEYGRNLHESGLHGGIFVFDEAFDWSRFAIILQITNSDQQARQLLQKEFNSLLASNTDRLLEQSMKTSVSNHSIEKALHERSSSLNNAITANTSSIIVDDLESFSTNKIFHNNQNNNSISNRLNEHYQQQQQQNQNRNNDLIIDESHHHSRSKTNSLDLT